MELTGINEIIKFLLEYYPNSIKRELELKKLIESDYFGKCPICGRHDWYLNIKSAQYFVCHKHKKRWCLGYNMFTDWKEENERIWKKNFKKIWNYDNISGDEWRNQKEKRIEQKFPKELPVHLLHLRIEEVDDII